MCCCCPPDTAVKRWFQMPLTLTVMREPDASVTSPCARQRHLSAGTRAAAGGACSQCLPTARLQPQARLGKLIPLQRSAGRRTLAGTCSTPAAALPVTHVDGAWRRAVKQPWLLEVDGGAAAPVCAHHLHSAAVVDAHVAQALHEVGDVGGHLGWGWGWGVEQQRRGGCVCRVALLASLRQQREQQEEAQAAAVLKRAGALRSWSSSTWLTPAAGVNHALVCDSRCMPQRSSSHRHLQHP
jgi:hypothetical protein